MTIPESLGRLVGGWAGTSLLRRPWVTPQDSESASEARVAPTARGAFVTIEYTWAADGEPHQSYAAPTGPDWGWRTVIAPEGAGAGAGAGADAFSIVMYNISPDGEETLAFRNDYARVAAPRPG